jgi:hypothetical protein
MRFAAIVVPKSISMLLFGAWYRYCVSFSPHLGLYMSVYVYMHAYMYVRVHLGLFMSVYVYMHVCMYVRVLVIIFYMYTRTYTNLL